MEMRVQKVKTLFTYLSAALDSMLPVPPLVTLIVEYAFEDFTSSTVMSRDINGWCIRSLLIVPGKEKERQDRLFIVSCQRSLK
jgi:hypothetical protein